MKISSAFTAVAALFLLAACGEDVKVGVTPWKETDKHLNCQQLLLEMNDARFWNQSARSKMDMGLEDYIWPVGYLGRRMSAEDAVGVTEARLANLQGIYQIKGCQNPYPGMNMPVQ